MLEHLLIPAFVVVNLAAVLLIDWIEIRKRKNKRDWHGSC